MKQIETLVRGVCIKGGRLLLCHTKGSSNTYLPGGHVEFEEPAMIALAREIEEELGQTSTVGRFLGAVEHDFIQAGDKHCEINLIFQIDIPGLDSDKEPQSMEDYIEFKWISLEELATSNLEPAVLRDLLPSWLDESEPVSHWGSTLGME